MEQLIIGLIAVAVLVLVVGLIAMSRKMAAKRVAAMRTAAERLGLEFEEKPPDALVQRLGGLKLFSTGHSRRAANLIVGHSEMIDIAAFDYRYTVGGGRNSATYIQTPICFLTRGLLFPQFHLRPENFFHRIGQAFGMKDFDFNTHPEFSRRYLLQGTNEEAVRALFTPTALQFFEAHPGFTVETYGGILVVYRSGQRSKAEKVGDDIDLAKQVFAVLAPQAQRVT